MAKKLSAYIPYCLSQELFLWAFYKNKEIVLIDC